MSGRDFQAFTGNGLPLGSGSLSIKKKSPQPSPQASPRGSLKHKQLKQVQAVVANESKIEEALQTPPNKHIRQKSAPNVKRRMRESKRPRPVDVNLSRSLFQSREGSTLTTPEPPSNPLGRKDSMEIKILPPTQPERNEERKFEVDKELAPILADFLQFSCQGVSKDQVLIDMDQLQMRLQGFIPEFVKHISAEK